MNTLQNKVAVITGANSGIGLATAKLYLQEGAKVVLAGRRKEALEAVSKELTTGDFITVVADVSKAEDNERLIQKTVDTYGKIFLVKDEIEKLDWKLGTETKFIGEYQCYKATYTKMVEKPRVRFSSDDDEEEEEETEPEMEERTVTAWYTPQIPINNGPDNYQGLPGLILEVHDGELTVICSKIVLNPKDKVEIKEPEKGKVVDQAKYDEIMEKKAREMMERYRPKKGERHDGASFSISIGG